MLRNLVRWAGLLVFGVLASCAAPPEREPESPPAVPQAEDAAPTYDPARLDELLQAAERALAEDRLLTPQSDNAYQHFQDALALEPDLPEARLGFERIVERYLALANRAIERERWASARSMLDRAAVVDRAHLGISALRRQVELLANARREVLRLVQSDVRARTGGVAARLAAFGEHGRQENTRVIIRAASDADGRWIYEQMRNAPGSRRIRASLQIGAPPQVTVLFLAASSVPPDPAK